MGIKLKSVEKSADRSILVKNDKLQTFYAPHHYHPDYEIIYIKKSFGLRIVGNNIDTYQTGEVVILGPGLPHYHEASAVQSDEEEAYAIETIAVLFPESIFEQNVQFPEFAKISSILDEVKYGIELLGHTKTQVQQLLETMTQSPSYINFVTIFRIFEALATDGSNYKQLSTLQYDSKNTYQEKTKKILDYISDRYLLALKVDELASEFGMSKSNFCIFFKNQTGLTFSHYLNMLRISKACELLAISQKSISEIAFEVGFENLSYFNRRFKDIKGNTPKAFRTALNIT